MSAPRHPRLERLLRLHAALGSLLLNVLLLLVIANVALALFYAQLDRARSARRGRVPGATRYDPRLLDAAYPDRSAEERDAMLVETRSRPFRCAPWVHYLEAPFRGRYVNVAAAGYRANRELPPWPPADGAFNVFVFGGSTTFGYGVADGETLPAFLEQELNARRAAPAPSTVVYNFAQGGYYSSQEQVLLDSLVRLGHLPDLAVFVDGFNEMGHFDDLPEHLGMCGGAAQEVGDRLPLLRFASALRYRLTGSNAAPPVTPGAPDTGLAGTEGILDRWQRTRELIRSAAQAHGFRVLFVWQPVAVYHYDLRHHIFAAALNELNRERVSRGYEVMAARRDSWAGWDDFLYLADIQRDKQEPLYIDRVHYSPKFNRWIARLIAERIVANGSGQTGIDHE